MPQKQNIGPTKPNAKKIWPIIKNRYRLSSKVQMNFELGFPEFLIGQCRVTAHGHDEIKTKKLSLAIKGIVLSDTIPLNWFTSSVFIPWEKMESIKCADDSESCTLKLNDPEKITIDLPWSEALTDYMERNRLFKS